MFVSISPGCSSSGEYLSTRMNLQDKVKTQTPHYTAALYLYATQSNAIKRIYLSSLLACQDLEASTAPTVFSSKDSISLS